MAWFSHAQVANAVTAPAPISVPTAPNAAGQSPGINGASAAAAGVPAAGTNGAGAPANSAASDGTTRVPRCPVCNARVRFVNMAPNVGPVDVYVNFALRAANVDTNTASAYIELPENAYSVSFDVAGTTSILLTLPSVSVTSGNTFSLYLMGTTGQLSGVLTRDD